MRNKTLRHTYRGRWNNKARDRKRRKELLAQEEYQPKVTKFVNGKEIKIKKTNHYDNWDFIHPEWKEFMGVW